MEKLVIALILVARRLHPYFQSDTKEIPSDQPIRQVHCKPESSSRLVKWVVELGEFDIHFKSRNAIKGQALVDFVAEFTSVPEANRSQDFALDLPVWKLYMDNVSNS